MGRGRRSTLDDLARLPWPVALVVGLLGYAVVRHGIPEWLARHGGPLGKAFAAQPDTLAPFAWMFLAICTLAAAASFFAARKRRRLLDTRTNLDSIAALGWRDFERLVGEAFRRRGYTVEETGLGGADGGIDLILSRDGKRTLVQCKHWKRERVPVNVVREMYGLVTHHQAHAVQIAAMGGFTNDAERFAEGKPITLINGKMLLSMIREVQEQPLPAMSSSAIPADTAPALREHVGTAPPCPRCSATMVLRKNRHNGAGFWGCSRYPACRGTEASGGLDNPERFGNST